MHGRTADGHVTCQASGSLHDCLAICQASTVDFIIRRCQGSRNIYHGFLWKSGVAASLPAGMEFVPEFHIHCYSCVPTHHGWCARLCSRLYRPADDRASVFYSRVCQSPGVCEPLFGHAVTIAPPHDAHRRLPKLLPTLAGLAWPFLPTPRAPSDHG